MMDVIKLYHTPLSIAVTAARTCWDSKGGCYQSATDELESSDRDLLYRLVRKYKHQSVVEHCTITFQIKGISRGCLQELARHRMQNLSVRSSRYTLGKALRQVDDFKGINDVAEFAVLTNNPGVDQLVFEEMRVLQKLLKSHKTLPNDLAKYAMPEALKTELVSTMNIRALLNFFQLRRDKSAHWEIYLLADKMLEALPNEWKFLFDGS